MLPRSRVHLVIRCGFGLLTALGSLTYCICCFTVHRLALQRHHLAIIAGNNEQKSMSHYM